jgi:hypothetical protein
MGDIDHQSFFRLFQQRNYCMYFVILFFWGGVVGASRPLQTIRLYFSSGGFMNIFCSLSIDHNAYGRSTVDSSCDSSAVKRYTKKTRQAVVSS